MQNIRSIKDIKKIRDIIPAIFATITKSPRYLPELVWNGDLFFHNIFRLYEAIFYRRFGARAEISVWQEKGKTYYKAHTFEATCTLVEHIIKEFLKCKWLPERVWIPQLVTAGSHQFLKSPFMFAIAFDANAEGSGSGSASFGLTASGSDLIITAGAWGNGGDQNITPTVDGAAMTNIGHAYESTDTYGLSFSYKLTTAAAHTIAGSSSGFVRITAMSISGANAVNGYQQDTTISSSAMSVTVTSATGNLVCAFFYNTNGTGTPTGTGRDTTTPTLSETASGAASVNIGYTSISGGTGLLVAANIVAGTQVTSPTVTTQTPTNIEKTTVTGNGNITNTGGENPHTRGICYVQGAGTPTTSDSKVQETGGSFGTGAFTEAITGLTKGTQYTFRAFAINSAGTSYGATSTITTKTDGVATKSLKYSVKASIGFTKQLIYKIKSTPSAKTKSLAYKTKSIPAAKTKSLSYRVRKVITAITKGLIYGTVKWYQPSTLTTTAGTIVSGILSDVYQIGGTNLVLSELSSMPGFLYDFSFRNVATGHNYSAHFIYDYTGTAGHNIKLQQWNFNTSAWDNVTGVADDFPHQVSMSHVNFELLNDGNHQSSGEIRLRLNHVSNGTNTHQFIIDQMLLQFLHQITKDLTYHVKVATAPTKSLKYTVKAPTGTTKTLKYTVKTTHTAITKGLNYKAKAPATALTKLLKFCIKSTPSAQTKFLSYRVVNPQAPLTKDIQYAIRSENQTSKGLEYMITAPKSITKSLQYICQSTSTHSITKSLKYTVTIPQSAITKSLQYFIDTQHAITKSIKYTIISPATPKTKSLRYVVKITQPAITKGLIYEIKKGKVKTKSLQYSILGNAMSTTKSLQYVIRIYPYSKQASPYHSLKKSC